MDFKTARRNMVQQQVRPWEVYDLKILEVLESLPRERFVLESYRDLAYSDTALPMGHHQVMLPPKIIGRILQCLNLCKKETVLEIGTGTGYLTACLAKLSKKVITIEYFSDLSQMASENLSALNIDNVQFETGNGLQGFSTLAPFDIIVLTGSIPYLPKLFRDQLEVRGRLFAIIGNGPVMSADLLTKLNKERWTEQSLFETFIPPLLEIPVQEAFTF